LGSSCGGRRAEIDRRVRDAAALLGAEALLHRRPRELSGGQRPRVALGRPLVREPAVFLMDEPLSNLDAVLRAQMRAESSKLRRRLGTIFVYVTHDQVEAMTMGDRIAILKNGAIQQVGTPREFYETSATNSVAEFIGTPAMSFLPGALIAREGTLVFETDLVHIPLPRRVVAALGSDRETTVVAGVRPSRAMVRSFGVDSIQGTRVAGDRALPCDGRTGTLDHLA